MSYMNLDHVIFDPIEHYNALKKKHETANYWAQQTGGSKQIERAQRASDEYWDWHCNTVQQGYVDANGVPTGKQQPKRQESHA